MQFLKWLRISLFTHVVIASGTVLLSMQTQLLLGHSLQQPWLYLFLFFATLLSYNTHFWLAARKSYRSEQLKWFRKKQTLVHLLNMGSLVAVLISGWQIPQLLLPLLPALLFNAAYTAPLLVSGKVKLPVVFTFVKSYFIGFTWAWVTVVVPVKDLQLSLTPETLLLFMNRLLLVSIATLIFDWRDRYSDQEWGVLTPANLFTEKQYRYFFLLNLACYGLLTIQQVMISGEILHYLQLALIPLMWHLYRYSHRQPPDSFYLLYVDGLLVLAPCLSLFLLF